MLKSKNKTTIHYECEYSIVFCTKYRKEILKDEVRTVLEDQIHQFFVEQPGLALNTLQVGLNYVYLTVEIDPQLSVSQVVRRLKIDTSTALRQRFKRLTQILPSIWTFNYFCTTKGPLLDETILEYVETQPKR